jgi:hypothetical protein
MGFEILSDGRAVYSINGPNGTKIYNTPEQKSWNKKPTFETVVLLDTYEPENGVMVASQQLFHTLLEIDAEKFAELNEKNPKYTYLRAMASGVFCVDWKLASGKGITSMGPLTLFKDDRKTPMPYVKTLSRTKIDKGMARMILRHLGRTPTPDVTQFLNT